MDWRATLLPFPAGLVLAAAAAPVAGLLGWAALTPCRDASALDVSLALGGLAGSPLRRLTAPEQG